MNERKKSVFVTRQQMAGGCLFQKISSFYFEKRIRKGHDPPNRNSFFLVTLEAFFLYQQIVEKLSEKALLWLHKYVWKRSQNNLPTGWLVGWLAGCLGKKCCFAVFSLFFFFFFFSVDGNSISDPSFFRVIVNMGPWGWLACLYTMLYRSKGSIERKKKQKERRRR